MESTTAKQKIEYLQKVKEALNLIAKGHEELAILWDSENRHDIELNEMLSNLYPYEPSHDELIRDIRIWIEDANHRLTKKQNSFGPTDPAGNEILKGSNVEVPEPYADDLYSHSFVGLVLGFRNGNAQVEDGDGNIYEIESRRLTVVE